MAMSSALRKSSNRRACELDCDGFRLSAPESTNPVALVTPPAHGLGWGKEFVHPLGVTSPQKGLENLTPGQACLLFAALKFNANVRELAMWRPLDLDMLKSRCREVAENCKGKVEKEQVHL